MNADELYQRPPEEFVAARDAAARSLKAAGDAAGARTLTALRKPSVAAWLVNRLATQQGELLDQLLALGPALAEAQSRGRAEDLRSLGQQRRSLVEAVTDSAVTGAGRPVTAAVREEVSMTLEAALADSASAQAVRSGRLVRALSYAGFGTVDLAGAVASDVRRTRPPPGTGPDEADTEAAAPAARQEAVAAAELAAHRAAGRLDDAVRACEKVARRLSAAVGALGPAEAEVARARAALDAAEQGWAAAQAAQARAQRDSDEALQAVRAAQDEAEAARSTLDRLRRGRSDS